jgi:hypothetical protein
VPVGGVAVSTLQLSTTLNGDITATADSIVLTDGSQFPTSGFIVIEKVNSDGIYVDETIEYTGRTTNTLTGCIRGTSAPYRGVTFENTTAGTHTSGAKIFGSYKVASLNTTQVEGTGQPKFSTRFDGLNVTLVSAATSSETGGGFQCTIGPVNDRA